MMNPESRRRSIQADKLVEDWAKSSNLRPKSVENYKHYINRLFAAANMTGSQVVTEAKADPLATYLKLKESVGNAKPPLTEKGRYTALHATRRFLRDHGILNLPQDRLESPAKVKPTVAITWDEALAICGACSKPYNSILKLMLHNGWGLTEFLKFNTAQTWKSVKTYLEAKPNAEYYRFGFTSRKKNKHEFYTLIPTSVLREIVGLGLPLPFRASKVASYVRKGSVVPQNREPITLDMDHYNSAKCYIETAWRTGLKRAPVLITQGQPSVHELRDTWRTRCTLMKVAFEPSEFGLGHTLDARGYIKCFNDEPWMWSELRKIYGSTATPEINTLKTQNEDLLTRLQRLEARDEEAKKMRNVLDRLTPEQERRFWEFTKGLKEKALPET